MSQIMNPVWKHQLKSNPFVLWKKNENVLFYWLLLGFWCIPLCFVAAARESCASTCWRPRTWPPRTPSSRAWLTGSRTRTPCCAWARRCSPRTTWTTTWTLSGGRCSRCGSETAPSEIELSLRWMRLKPLCASGSYSPASPSLLRTRLPSLVVNKRAALRCEATRWDFYRLLCKQEAAVSEISGPCRKSSLRNIFVISLFFVFFAYIYDIKTPLLSSYETIKICLAQQ